MFTYKQLSKATRNFSKENLLGKGGFGSVYRGIISVPPKVVAVKKISATSKQGLLLCSNSIALFLDNILHGLD